MVLEVDKARAERAMQRKFNEEASGPTLDAIAQLQRESGSAVFRGLAWSAGDDRSVARVWRWYCARVADRFVLRVDRFHAGSQFAQLCGGAVIVEEYRGRESIRCFLSAAVSEARARRVPSSHRWAPMSRPILERKGFRFVPHP